MVKYESSGNVLNMSSWQSRLVLIIGPEGYKDYMRLSLQTVCLYEAKRCISHRLKVQKLRPFQRRHLLMAQLYALLDELALLDPLQKEEVLWKTRKKKEQLDSVTAWNRCGIIERDLAKMLEGLQPFLDPFRTHQRAVDMLVYHLFNTLKRKPKIQRSIHAEQPSSRWEFAHNHTLLTLRMYFIGTEVDRGFPAPIGLSNTTPLPVERPPGDKVWHRTFTESSANLIRESIDTDNHASRDEVVVLTDAAEATDGNSTTVTSDTAVIETSARHSAEPESSSQTREPHQPASSQDQTSTEDTSENTLDRLMAVRDQMDLLNEFKGVISDDELNEKKKELFKQMPSPLAAPEISDGKDDDCKPRAAAYEPSRSRTSQMSLKKAT